MSLNLAGVNYLAVVVAGLVVFFLGGLWYTALFGKLWVKLHGYSPEQVKAMQAKRPPAVFFGGMVACYCVLALAVALLVVGFNVSSVGDGILVGVLLWVGPAAALAMTGHLASDKPIGTYAIDVCFQLLALVTTGAIVGGWR